MRSPLWQRVVPARLREGEATGEGFLMGVDRTISAVRKLGPTGISQVSISDMEQKCVVGVWFCFVVLRYYIKLSM